jgi:cellulose synthase/poly-beta-1,6-N-acetylglucosamine synthase-like glycosyltransferase
MLKVSIIIPIKLESEDRKFNLKNILTYLNSYDIKIEIIIVEQYNYKRKTDYNVDQFLKENLINYDFLKVIKYPSTEEFFYKTKLINLGILNSKFPISYPVDDACIEYVTY